MQWKIVRAANGIRKSGQFANYMCESPVAAFSAYAELCDDFITQAKTFQLYDGNHMPKAPFNA